MTGDGGGAQAAVRARRILLVRHGRPAIVRSYRRWTWVPGRQVPELLARYDASGIDAESSPSDGLRERVSSAERVFASDLPRARESASRLGVGERAVEDAVFREAMPPSGFLPFLRLPVTTWLTVARLAWLLGLPLDGETWKAARERASVAADRLEAVTAGDGTTVLVAHGWINWLIREALSRRGWTSRAPYAREYWAANELARVS
jgi:broad specificity phosphatase PhoE